MAYIGGFGSYLPSRIVTNAELADRLGCSADWIQQASGIEERRYGDDETVDEMGAKAAEACLARTGVAADRIGMLIVASGSGDLRFPGPASMVAKLLGLSDGAPALDVPMASAGGLFAMAMAARFAEQYENVLVVASEKMSSVVAQPPLDQNTAILFGDGAGGCLISRDSGAFRIVDAVLHTDGSFAQDLRLACGGRIEMNGRSVILQAARKIPSGIQEVLKRNNRTAAEIESYIMHQANQNLMDRVARALEIPADRIYSNIRKYGNTSSASMFIAADEWHRGRAPNASGPICFAVFGAGFHWGALLAE